MIMIWQRRHFNTCMIAAKPWPFSGQFVPSPKFPSYLLTQSGIVHNDLYPNKLEIATQTMLQWVGFMLPAPYTEKYGALEIWKNRKNIRYKYLKY